jgi:hypothetical protein
VFAAMRAHHLIIGIGLLACLPLQGGCGGGSTPKAEAPEKSAKSGKDEVSEDADTADESKGDKSKKSSAKKEEPVEDTSPKPTRTAHDIITAPDVAFVFSFTNSEVGEKAEESCSKKSKNDPKKQTQCMQKARKEITADVHAFTKDKEGKFWWTISRVQGSKLRTLHKVQIEFSDDKADSITIKPVSKDRGTKPWANPPAKVAISVPNEFSIELKDPTYGKMVYEAKIGLLGKD